MLPQLTGSAARATVARAMAPLPLHSTTIGAGVGAVRYNSHAHAALKEFPPGAPIPKEYFGYVPPDPKKAEEFNKHINSYVSHAEHSGALWAKLTFFATLPVIGLTAWYVYGKETEHIKHHEHELEENGGELPPRPKYEYLNWKVKEFPWGKQTLFFNPK